MTRGVWLYLVGSLVLVGLAGCGHGFLQFAQREPWRHEAEVQCLRSGAVKEGAGIVRIEPIDGPGICGADFPLKVAYLGDSSPYGYDDEPRPPGTIANAGPRWPIAAAPPAAAPAEPPRYTPVPAGPPFGNPEPGAPFSIAPPGQESAAGEVDDIEPPTQYGAPAPYGGADRPYPSEGLRPAPVPLGPERTPQVTAAGPVAVKPAATLACPIVSVLQQWLEGAVQPAAQRWFGQRVVEIKQISAYSCRGMNGIPGAHISEHAFGNALDIAAFTLADGRRVVVQTGWYGAPEEQGFLRDVEAAACQEFNTVLAPGSNRYHYNHIHVDLMRRASGRRICEPRAVDGEAVAARAAAQRGYAAHGDPGVTGSIRRHAPAQAAGPPPAGDDGEWIEDEGQEAAEDQ